MTRQTTSLERYGVAYTSFLLCPTVPIIIGVPQSRVTFPGTSLIKRVQKRTSVNVSIGAGDGGYGVKFRALLMPRHGTVGELTGKVQNCQWIEIQRRPNLL